MESKNVVYPEVLIGIPVFNGGKCIFQTLNSLLNQNYPNYKILVCDNSSTDNTKDIVLKLMSKYPDKINYLLNPILKSAEENWNFLLQNAPVTSKYMALYHADDVYDSNIVEKQVEYLEKYSVAASFTMCRMINEEGNPVQISYNGLLPKVKSACPAKVYNYNELMEDLMRYHNFIRTPSFLFNRELISSSDISFNNKLFSSSSDLDVWLRLAKINKIVIINEFLFSYRLSTSQGSYVLTKGREVLADFFKVMDHHLNELSVKPKNEAWLETQRSLDLIFCALNSVRKNNVINVGQKLDNAIKLKYFFKSLKFSRTHFIFGILLKIAFKLGIERQFVRFIDSVRS